MLFSNCYGPIIIGFIIFELTLTSLANMYIHCFPQVVFPYFKNKKLKEGKIPKIKIKGIKRKISKRIKMDPKNKTKRDKNKT